MTVVVVFWLHGTPEALATFSATATAANTFTAHRLVTPTLSCNGLGVLAVHLSWTAAADTSQPDIYGSGFLASGYELARGTTPGGPYPTVVSTSLTTFDGSLSGGDYYYVVRTVKHSWKGVVSNERHVRAVLFLLATCS